MTFNELEMYLQKDRTIIFDLDNTLYDENIFLFKVYENIALYVSNIYKIDKQLIINYLKNIFISEGRKNLLEKMLIEFKLKNKLELNELFKFFREEKYFNNFNLNIFHQLLNFLSNKEFCIITNGNIKQQELKIKLLKLNNTKVKEIIYANEYEPKPSIEALIELSRRIELKNPVYIGDSKTDEEFANKSGIEFIKVDYQINHTGHIDSNTLNFTKK